MPPADQRAAQRAAMRGPVPADPRVRGAAHRLAVHQFAEATRQRTRQLVTFATLDALYVLLALGSSPWWWVPAAAFAALLAVQVWTPGHLRRRLALLQAEG